MNHMSLYAGVGAMTLAAQRAGMAEVALCDAEPFCRQVLAKRFPGVPIFDYDTDVTVEALAALGITQVDVISGGFPCQPHSLAGKRKGDADERNRWPEMARIIGDFRPTWVLGENVRGMVSNGFLDTICADLEDLGYEVRPFVLPTGVASGSPHLRERVFVVAYSRSRQCERSNDEVRAGRYTPDGRSYKQLAARERSRLETLADTSGEGLAQRPELRRDECPECEAAERNDVSRGWSVGSTQPGVGRNPDGLSGGVDRLEPRWPAGRGEHQYAWEPPRLTQRRDLRRDRIKALGNSAVWQTLYPFFRAMVLAER